MGNPNPLIIKLNNSEVNIGFVSFPILKQYPQVLSHHALFVKLASNWYVKRLQMSGKLYRNRDLLTLNRLYEVDVGDHILFGDSDPKCKRFVCSLSVKAIEMIDLSSDDLPNIKKEQCDYDSSMMNSKATDHGHLCSGLVNELKEISNIKSELVNNNIIRELEGSYNGLDKKAVIHQYATLSNNHSTNSDFNNSFNTFTNQVKKEFLNRNVGNFSDGSNIKTIHESSKSVKTNSELGFLDNTEASLPKSDDSVIKMERDYVIDNTQKGNINKKLVFHVGANSNLGYSESDEVITISDDEAYLDFSSSQIVSVEHSDDEDWNSPVFCNSLTLNRIDDQVNSPTNEINLFSNIVPKINQEHRGNIKIFNSDENGRTGILVQQNKLKQNAELYPISSKSVTSNLATENSESVNFDHTVNSLEDDSSNSSVSSHDEIIIPFSRKKRSGKVRYEKKEFGGSSKIALSHSEKNDWKDENIKSKIQPVRKVLFTEPKQIIRRPKKIHGHVEKDRGERKKIQNDSLSSNSNLLSKTKISPKYSKKGEQLVSNKKTKVSHASNKWSDGNIMIGALTKNSVLSSYKIPKKLSSDKKSQLSDLVKNKELTKPTEMHKTYSLNKKIPSIARKPDKYASRSAFLIEGMSSEKRKSSSNRKINSSSPIQATKVSSTTTNKFNIPSVVNIRAPSAISDSDQMKSESHAPKPVNTNHLIGLNINTTCIDTLSAMTKNFPTADLSLPKSENFHLGHQQLSSKEFQVLSDKRSSLKSLQINFMPHKNEVSVLNHQMSNIDPLRQSNNHRQNRCAVVDATLYNEEKGKDKIFEHKADIEMIKNIVEWKDIWLKEQQMMTEPPASLTNGVLHLPLYFYSFDHYVSSFVPMLLLEVWEKLYQASKPIWEDEKRTVNKFYFIIVSSKNSFDMTEYHCEALVNKISFSPETGKVVILQVKDQNVNSFYSMLGYIFSHRVQSDNSIINPELKNVDQMWMNRAELWQFSIFVKKRPLYPILNKIMKGNGICSILKDLNLVNGFQNLKSSPLCPYILKPDPSFFFSNYPCVVATAYLSKSQRAIVDGISTELQKQEVDPKIFLLHGLPGSGKTYVIYKLLEELIFNLCLQLKVLVVAPSSTTIDEIGSRFVELIERSSWRSVQIKLVRLGLQNKVSKKMQPFTLDAHYAKNMFVDKEEKLEQIRMNIEHILNRNDAIAQQELKILVEEQRLLRNELDFLKSDKKSHWNYYCHLLKESHIIFTTLSCCSWPILTAACKPYSCTSFSCCIIDDATQCTEMEILQIMALGINKLILVGDPLQLSANVLSKKAASLGYGRSMFERFIYFSKTQQEDLFFTLTEQFRMHSEICSFPSNYFYDNQLTTAQNIDQKYENFPLNPYSVYVIENSEETSFSENWKADAIINLCIQLLTMKPVISIGIIVPNQEIQGLYSKWIEVLKLNPKYGLIEINTVEKFQGREKDVIILSCHYDGKLNSFLFDNRKLNVALTRARQCLILCMFSSACLPNAEWRKLVEDALDRKFFWIFQDYKDIHLIYKL
ncbi:probable helicase senataxin [Nephila pilipes]|uniref:Probable helicase senataxin n=1 Tax=Nephila pilipes TaxID=299642 RepID=A0A8X6NT61_NEPPI|nr:probable helicase senataxin [Nephila pilipes]